MLETFRRQPSAMLLAAQVAGVLVYPFVTAGEGQITVFNAIGIVVLVLTVRAVRATHALSWVAGVLGVPAIVLLVVQSLGGDPDLGAWSSALAAGLYFYAAGALIAYILADQMVNRDELFAVGATFTLLAWAFAYAYLVCQKLAPGSFTAAADADAPRAWIELLGLSFTNLTSTGLGDVLPVKPFARGLVMLEQLAGVAYVAMLVSRVVGLTVQRRQP